MPVCAARAAPSQITGPTIPFGMRRKALQHGLVGALSVVAVLLVVEGLARLAEPTLPAWRGSDGDAVIMTGHPTRLWGMTEGKRWNDGAMATINERGLRGELPELPRPEGRLRLLRVVPRARRRHGAGRPLQRRAHHRKAATNRFLAEKKRSR